jgi:hypothetical protein
MDEKSCKAGKCELCGKVWQPINYGNARRCAFETDTFSEDNWNCGLVSVIREEMATADGQMSLKFRSDDIGSYGVLVVAVPQTGPQPEDEPPRDHSVSGLLVGTWYKDRGATDELKWAFSDRVRESSDLTRTEAVQIAGWIAGREEREARARLDATEREHRMHAQYRKART